MNDDRIKTLIYAILGTLAETHPRPAIESHLYIACGMDIEAWNNVRNVIVNAGWATVKGYQVRLTESGVEIGNRINEAFATV